MIRRHAADLSNIFKNEVRCWKFWVVCQIENDICYLKMIFFKRKLKTFSLGFLKGFYKKIKIFKRGFFKDLLQIFEDF